MDNVFYQKWSISAVFEVTWPTFDVEVAALSPLFFDLD
jgi:hypothetical protein